MAIIVDVDDTLLRYSNRPIRSVIDYINSLDELIVIVSGRPLSRKDETTRALRRVGIKFSRIYLRPAGDGEVNSIPFKRQTAQRLKSQMDISMAIDNDPAARRAYASLGIPTKDPALLPKITEDRSEQ